MKHRTRYARRYTSRRRKRADVHWIAGIAVLGLLIYLCLAMGAGAWAHSLLFGADDMEEQNENEHSDAEITAEVYAQEITETVAFPAMEYFALSVKTQEGRTARETAMLCKARGGAGFVYENEVLLAAYESRSTCKSVAESLIQEQDLETGIVPVQTDAVELRLTALPRRIDGVREAFSVWQQTVQHMDALWQDLDGGVAGAKQALGRVREKKETLEEICSETFDNALLSGRSDALEGLYGVIADTIDQMDALLLVPEENTLEVSAGIKYTVIRALTEYKAYVDALKQE